MQDDAYRRLPGVTFSMLKHMHVSPARYRHYENHPHPDKKEFVHGRALHCRILEPDEYDARYAVGEGLERLPSDWRAIANGHQGVDWDSCPAKVRRGKEWTALAERYSGNPIRLLTAPEVDAVHAAYQKYGDREILSPAEDRLIGKMATEIRGHAIAGAVFRGSGQAEVIAQWDDPVTGLRCKGRLDYLRNDCVADLKTTSRITVGQFRRQAAELLYYGQLAWYADGAILAGLIPGDPPPRQVIVAVTPGPPVDVMVFELSTADAIAGKNVYRTLLNRLNDCLHTDRWPGVAPDLELLRLPRWAFGMDEDDSELPF
jgi:hypothetical protein